MGKKLFVTDLCCSEAYPERQHSVIVNGEIVPVTFRFGEVKEMDYELGVKFMNDGFRVLDEEERALRAPVQADVVTASRLAFDEVVAKLDELTTDALRLRAVTRPGGEILLNSEDKDEIIAFLLADKDAGEDAGIEDEDGYEVDADMVDDAKTAMEASAQPNLEPVEDEDDAAARRKEAFDNAQAKLGDASTITESED